MKQPAYDAVLSVPMCPLCHTPFAIASSRTDTDASWRCSRCDQLWTATRLATVAAYAQYCA